jgi:hypothetical protein
MPFNRWQQIEEIFQSALDLAPPERINFVSENCTGDRELQREVEKLLADYESALRSMKILLSTSTICPGGISAFLS